ncbi:MAG: prepilin-type N-terminal cleavage/methylation domain-containing protein [Fibrobacter sp.]|nr:prepilin-type N-terminal cleavage/methylation domain-containing protein [Fibrobacter sp.]
MVKAPKKGFGIIEVLIAIAALGFLYMAVNHLQTGNRDTLLRIRGRDGAIEVAQQVVDSLSSLGISSLQSGATIIIPEIKRTWKGQPGSEQYEMTVKYKAKIVVGNDSKFTRSEETAYGSTSHVYGKHLDVSVSWDFKGSEQSISVSRIIQ